MLGAYITIIPNEIVMQILFPKVIHHGALVNEPISMTC
jgi:hypothetical protein